VSSYSETTCSYDAQNTHEPSSFFVHHALSADWRHLLVPIDRARKQCEPHRDPNLFLYRRSRRELPTGRWSRPLHRGTSPREALSKLIWRRRSHMVAAGETARSANAAIPTRALAPRQSPTPRSRCGARRRCSAASPYRRIISSERCRVRDATSLSPAPVSLAAAGGGGTRAGGARMAALFASRLACYIPCGLGRASTTAVAAMAGQLWFHFQRSQTALPFLVQVSSVG
jgi:hypothetical protein